METEIEVCCECCGFMIIGKSVLVEGESLEECEVCAKCSLLYENILEESEDGRVSRYTDKDLPF